eukprot:NODE_1536_length_916_cov_433.716263_g1193_i0.p1 GENE.NODE_1536_length_916_cov_433.716263_g1193_i0~~NODE_1536_length_916_cov_433.716263_g1193_i0.p1  ORF type:complete len:278 (+),score=101.38 NODE_1536_length_916_cov_433.716263_g1193_i0:58-834(+)
MAPKKAATPKPAAPTKVPAQANVPAPERKAKSQVQRKGRLYKKLVKKEQTKDRRKLKSREVVARYYKYKARDEKLAKILKHQKRIAELGGNYYVEPEARIAFVVRIRGINDVPPKQKKILQLLRLRQIFNGVFIRLNKAVVNMLRLAGAYITWGYPTKETIRKLINKRGHGFFNHRRLKLTNWKVEKALGKYNIICVEDMIQELHTTGKYFKEVNSFLCPFKLRAPKGGLKQKRIHFVEGGDAGNRESYINQFIGKIL